MSGEINVKVERCKNGVVVTQTVDGEQESKRVMENRTDAELLYCIGVLFELNRVLITDQSQPDGDGVNHKSYAL